MFHKNLKYYRLKKNMTRKALAVKCGITPMSITHYEHGSRKPSMSTLKALADALDVKVSDFIVARNKKLLFEYERFPASDLATKNQRECIKEDIEEYFNRFFTMIEILGGDVLPAFPPYRILKLTSDIEKDASMLRSHLGFSINGPIGNLIASLENLGILIYNIERTDIQLPIINGFINKRPYFVINSSISFPQVRYDLSRELVHLMFDLPKNVNDHTSKKRIDSIAGAFLFPKKDVKRELGIRRKALAGDTILVCHKYSIPLELLIRRAEQCNIITKSIARHYLELVNNDKIKSSSFIADNNEKPFLFEQLVYRAISENEISIQKGAELLRTSYSKVEKMRIIEAD